MPVFMLQWKAVAYLLGSFHMQWAQMDFRDVILETDVDCVTPLTLKYNRRLTLACLLSFVATTEELVPCLQ